MNLRKTIDRTLENHIAQIHAAAVIKGINGIDCKTEQKLRLINAILKEDELRSV